LQGKVAASASRIQRSHFNSYEGGSKGKLRNLTVFNWPLLLFCALTFYYFAVLKIEYREGWLLDLGHSNATEYFAQAKALLKDGYPYLQIGYKKLPSMYPLGDLPMLQTRWRATVSGSVIPLLDSAPGSV
jgi:hypothetical protein